MTQVTGKQVADILGTIEELRASVVTFENIVNAHLNVLSEKLQYLQQNEPGQTDERDNKQQRQNSIFSVQSSTRPLELYKVQRLPVQPLVNRQLTESGCSSPGYTEEEGAYVDSMEAN